MEITNEVFEAANRRGQAMKARFPAAVAVRYDHHGYYCPTPRKGKNTKS